MAAVFPFTDEQVAEVADTLGSTLEIYEDEYADELAREALSALARVMRVEREGDGWDRVRGVTEWFTVDRADS